MSLRTTLVMVALVALLFVSITEPFLLGTFSMIALIACTASIGL